MAKVKITGHASGSGVLTVTAPNTSTDRTITLPDATATIATTTDVAARLPSITDGGNATAITIDSSEQVGIGATSPASKLDLREVRTTTYDASNYTTWSSMHIHNTTDTTNVATGISFSNDASVYTNGSAGIAAVAKSGDSEQDLVFITRPLNAVSAERLRITSDGRGLSQFTAKAWVNFNGTGTVAINDSHNVSSITDVATGKFTIVMTNALGNTLYAPVGSSSGVVGVLDNTNVTMSDEGNRTTTQFKAYTRRSDNNTYADTASVTIVVFGD